MDANVSLPELSKKTKNFSGAEIEGLVRAAQSSAMNRLVRAGGRVEVEEDAVEKLMINKDDFEYALENDIKPVSIFKYSKKNLLYHFSLNVKIFKKFLLKKEKLKLKLFI